MLKFVNLIMKVNSRICKILLNCEKFKDSETKDSDSIKEQATVAVNNEVEKEKHTSPHFWSQKKFKNWFCNRPLSPITNPLDVAAEENMGTNKNNVIILQNTVILPTNLESEKDTSNMGMESQMEPTTTNERSSEVDEILDYLEKSSSEVPENNEHFLVETISNGRTSLGDEDTKVMEDSLAEIAGCHKNIYKRKQDHCYFCETDVLNFGRHILRSHPMEFEVIQISSMPTKSRERRRMIDILRRKGNYLGENSKPVRQSYVSNQSMLPCDNCLGFFSAKLLYRHRKKCGKKLSGTAQAAGQSLLASHIRVDPRLSKEVFPHMRADKISLEAKKDTLICAFAARYLTTHREKHMIHVTSRKMRELARLLLEIKKMEPSIRNLIQALDPQYFDLFIQGTKIISRYDADTDRYNSPTLAMNIVNALKECCDIALTFLMTKKNYMNGLSSAEAEANYRGMLHLFKCNWRFEVSSQAANNLNLNKWNKVTIVPLANDLKLLKNYLSQTAEGALKKLKKNRFDSSAYTALMETVYCRTILLNRKRPGELERMQVHTYVTSADKSTYEEFGETMTPTEQILLKNLKRIVIRGKRGRGVPVLFPKDVQDHIKILLDVRSNFVPLQNNYLFGRVGKLTPISGYKVLSKYTKACGAKNPAAITSTRLRKHLATLTQIFNMNEQDIEQLATFMGHTPGIHRQAYRLPDDIYQTAKISKILLLMEKGDAGRYQGKSINEINIDMENNLLEENQTSDSDSEEIPNNEAPFTESTLKSTDNEVKRSTRPIKKGKKRELVPWTTEQKNIVKDFFKVHIRNKKPPKRNECEELIQRCPEQLKNKNWVKIKVFVQNEYMKSKKSKKYISSDSE